jgi:hypothetical protein
MKEIIRKRKQMRKKGTLTGHSEINNGTLVYCNTLQLATDGQYVKHVTVGQPYQSTDASRTVSYHFRTVKAARPLRCEEAITNIKPFERGRNPKIIISGGEVVDTVLVDHLGPQC